MQAVTNNMYFSSHEDIQASSGSGISSNLCLASCCAVLAMVCADPEYRVYITALVGARIFFRCGLFFDLAFTNQIRTSIMLFSVVISFVFFLEVALLTVDFLP